MMGTNNAIILSSPEFEKKLLIHVNKNYGRQLGQQENSEEAIPQKSADLITFTEEILNGKPHFLSSDYKLVFCILSNVLLQFMA